MTDFDAAVLRIANESGIDTSYTNMGSGSILSYADGVQGIPQEEMIAFARAMCRYQAAKDAEICQEADADCDGICQRAIEKAAGEL